MPDVFWQSSVLEIQDMMKAHDTKRERWFKDLVLAGFATADAIATRVGSVFTEPKKRRESDITQPWDSFPDLFREEEIIASVREQAADMEQYKADMTAYAERWNRRYRNASKDDIRT